MSWLSFVGIVGLLGGVEKREGGREKKGQKNRYLTLRYRTNPLRIDTVV